MHAGRVEYMHEKERAWLETIGMIHRRDEPEPIGKLRSFASWPWQLHSGPFGRHRSGRGCSVERPSTSLTVRSACPGDPGSWVTMTMVSFSSRSRSRGSA